MATHEEAPGATAAAAPKAVSAAPKAEIATYKRWYEEANSTSVDWREESVEDSKFYHGGKGQWKQADIDTLTNEGRPVLSINRIKPTIDLQKGIEIRSRTDIDAKPRGQNDGGTADAITAGFKYIQDQNNADHKVSDVFFDGLKAGIGWIEICLNDDPREEEIAVLYKDWHKIGWDPYARDVLLDDARYMFENRWVDLDIAQQTWPDKADELTAMMQDAKGETGETAQHDRVKPDQYQSGKPVQYCDTTRQRVRLVKMYFKKMQMAIFLKLKDGEAIEVSAEALQRNPEIVANPYVIRVAKVPVQKMYCVIFSGDVILEEEKPSVYEHNRFPLIPFICYMDEDGQPYGMVRNMKDPQREINKNRSQYSHIITTRRVFFESGSLKNPLEAKTQISRPDAWIELMPGALNMKRFQFSQDVAVAREHFEIMREAKQELQEVSGSVQEQMGQETNARSGVAIEARQRQGATVNTEPFDNLRLTKRRMGELMLSMMRQYWTYEKVIRITDDQTGGDKFVTFNQAGKNDISQGRYDVVVADHPETETTRQWMSRTLMDFASKMSPDIAIPVMQVAFEMTDIPNKDKVMEKLAQAAAKQDALTQQKILSDQIKGEKPPPAPAAAPEAPPAPGPPLPKGVSPKEVIRRLMAGEKFGDIEKMTDKTALAAAEFLVAPKPLAAGDKAASPPKA
jgi:hypothetical protein